MERQKLTPKEDRSRDKWRTHLVAYQYKIGITAAEMDERLTKEKEENIEKNYPIKTSTTIYNEDETNIDINSAAYVLGYLNQGKSTLSIER